MIDGDIVSYPLHKYYGLLNNLLEITPPPPPPPPPLVSRIYIN